MENQINEFEMVKNLAEKIEKLSIVVGNLSRDGRNQHSKYNYISNEKMVTALRTNCLEYKISIIPAIVDFVENEFTSANGKLTIRTIVTMSFQIIDLETGYSMTRQFSGAENDTGGKSFQQSVTQCTKYFYFKLFNVTSSDEIDGDSNTTVILKSGSTGGGGYANNPEKQWLTESQFEQIIAMTDKSKVQQYLEHYKTDTHGMKKAYREKITEHLNNLK